MPLINLGRGGGKIIWRGNLSRNSQGLISFLIRPHPELKWKVAFSTLRGPAWRGKASCNYSPSSESGHLISCMPWPPLKCNARPNSPGRAAHGAPAVQLPSPRASWEEGGALLGSLSGCLAWGWMTRFFPPQQLSFHILGSVSKREPRCSCGTNQNWGRGIRDVP